ncbi:Serine-threonine/tyrosine-protein kinase, catalytic domain [Dillenia turbinata]|uniref:Serine-threonine/tyrosine-protein kinase, catalytic domain n=1 Tax=Dillenia turbinata TaxID=194707 RepID=A0AAN8UQA4_9MAGN
MESEDYEERKERAALVAVVVLTSLAVASLLIALSYYCYIRNKISKRLKFQKGQFSLAESVLVFTYKQLHSATGGFGKSNVIGHGAFGSVYRGVLHDGLKVAVKLMDRAGKQGVDEFKVEIELLSRLRAPHLLALIGYFSDKNHKLLVYEFMANGVLQNI